MHFHWVMCIITFRTPMLIQISMHAGKHWKTVYSFHLKKNHLSNTSHYIFSSYYFNFSTTVVSHLSASDRCLAYMQTTKHLTIQETSFVSAKEWCQNKSHHYVKEKSTCFSMYWNQAQQFQISSSPEPKTLLACWK